MAQPETLQDYIENLGLNWLEFCKLDDAGVSSKSIGKLLRPRKAIEYRTIGRWRRRRKAETTATQD